MPIHPSSVLSMLLEEKWFFFKHYYLVSWTESSQSSDQCDATFYRELDISGIEDVVQVRPTEHNCEACE